MNRMKYQNAISELLKVSNIFTHLYPKMLKEPNGLPFITRTIFVAFEKACRNFYSVVSSLFFHRRKLREICTYTGVTFHGWCVLRNSGCNSCRTKNAMLAILFLFFSLFETSPGQEALHAKLEPSKADVTMSLTTTPPQDTLWNNARVNAAWKNMAKTRHKLRMNTTWCNLEMLHSQHDTKTTHTGQNSYINAHNPLHCSEDDI